MGRPKDEQYWNQVTKEENGMWKCKHCNRTFSGGVSRIKAHVDRIKGQGIAICSGDRNNEGVHNNMASGLSNPQEAENGENSLQGAAETTNTIISGSMNNQNNIETFRSWEDLLQANNETRVIGSSCTKSAFESEINHLKQLDFDLQREESDIEEQTQWLQSRGKKRKREVDTWLNGLQELKKRVVHMNDVVDPLPNNYGVEINQLIEEMQKHKVRKPLALSTELVGETFDENIKQVLKLLADDQVFIIGIYGMGGVGKTLLASHVENEIERKGTFKVVLWVTVSHNFSISRLQHDIAKKMGVKLDEDDDERTRAAILSLALETKKEKSVLILDDVWKYIDLQKVGIPFKVNGIKVILTTRLKQVCQQMDCLPDNMITMSPLYSYDVDDDDDEAMELFLLKLGHNGTRATLPPEVLKIARSIVKRCDGLPLAISVMARTMKGVNDIHRWKHARNKLKKLEWGEEVEEGVIKVLKRSYDNLMEKNMQNCFLYSALLLDFERDELIMKLNDRGLINGRSLEEIFDEGHTILDILEAHSLLGPDSFIDWDFAPHHLVTGMACHILKETGRHVMVKHNKRGECDLIIWPPVQEWTAELELVNLSDNDLDPCNIEEIPEGTSPCCPRLSTLIIRRAFFSHIPECFFIHTNALAVLDLSYNRILESLPKSVSNLRSLVSLVLKGCESLRYVPPLEELQKLSRLVISSSLINQVPQGLEKLTKLKWLDLSGNKNLMLAPGTVLPPNLTNMQYLDLRFPGALIKVKRVQRMNMLEHFGGSFLNLEIYNHFVQEIRNTVFGPKTYHLLFKVLYADSDKFDLKGVVPRNAKSVHFGDCNEFPHELPGDLTELHIRHNNQWICLCNALSSNADASSSLRIIDICNCTQLKSLFCSSGSCSLCTKIHNLESLYLEQLQTLTIICKEDVGDVGQSFSRGDMFSRLKHFKISHCHEIEKLLTPGLVLQLRNLETVTVYYCRSMKEIFAVGNGDDDGSTFSIELPKLTGLCFSHLLQLKIVCKGIIFCQSSPHVDIECCPNLERRPTIEIKPDFD